MPKKLNRYQRYWRTNLVAVAWLLVVWFLVGCVLSIFLVEPLNEFQIGGFPLGFWIAQQGAIFTFILLILIYALIMRRADRRFEEQKEEKH